MVDSQGRELKIGGYLFSEKTQCLFRITEEDTDKNVLEAMHNLKIKDLNFRAKIRIKQESLCHLRKVEGEELTLLMLAGK